MLDADAVSIKYAMPGGVNGEEQDSPRRGFRMAGCEKRERWRGNRPRAWRQKPKATAKPMKKDAPDARVWWPLPCCGRWTSLFDPAGHRRHEKTSRMSEARTNRSSQARKDRGMAKIGGRRRELREDRARIFPGRKIEF